MFFIYLFNFAYCADDVSLSLIAGTQISSHCLASQTSDILAQHQIYQAICIKSFTKPFCIIVVVTVIRKQSIIFNVTVSALL